MRTAAERAEELRDTWIATNGGAAQWRMSLDVVQQVIEWYRRHPSRPTPPDMGDGLWLFMWHVSVIRVG